MALPLDATSQKQARAARARANGAKSKGPLTPAGKAKVSQNARKHSAYASAQTLLLDGDNPEQLAHLRQNYLDTFHPQSQPELDLVDQLVSCEWLTRRLLAVSTALIDHRTQTSRHRGDYKSRLALSFESLYDQGRALSHLDRRLEALARQSSRLRTDLYKLQSQRAPQPKQTHNSAQTHDFLAPQTPPQPAPAPETPSQWAAQNLDLIPDSFQSQILDATEPNLLICAGRQTGKSTAAAARILHHAAVERPNTTVCIAAPSQVQSNRVLAYVKQMANQAHIPHKPAPKPNSGIVLDNGSQILALPANPASVRGHAGLSLLVIDEAAFANPALFPAIHPAIAKSNGTLIVLSTPNGQHNYFAHQWHAQNTNWRKIQQKSSQSPRLNPQFLADSKLRLGHDLYQQEFECDFLHLPHHPISLDLIESALADDCVPFLQLSDEEIQINFEMDLAA